jgi:putative endonuclease
MLPGFSAKYGVDRLVWYEAYVDVTEAIRREKVIKKWRRDWKIALIEADNPNWYDLYDGIAV